MDIRADKQWLTAAEAADEKLPGFAFGERHIRKIIDCGDIASRPRKGQSGRPSREFHWSSLPAGARDEYLKRYGVACESQLDDPRGREARKDLQAQARSLIVAAFGDYFTGRDSNKTRALKSFCRAFEKQRLKLDGWVFRIVPAVAPHQIALWESRLRRGDSLLDGRGRPAGTGLFETDLELRNYTVARIVERPHLSAKHVAQLLAAELGREIPLRTVQHFLCGFRKTARPELKALTNPDKYRSHHKPAFGIVGGRVERINARWEIDASPADAMCLVDGRERRMKIVGVIDVFTRRAMVLVSDQARAVATMALVRRAILAWGMPALLKVDNGKEFANRAVERFCRDTGIEVSFSRAFTPEQKPHIERFFGTLARDFFELLPGYIGHNVADRQGIEARRSYAHRFGERADLSFGVPLAPAELQGRIDQWCANIYEQRHHEGIALRPCDLAIAHAADVRRLPDERLLDALMLDAPDGGGIRLVGKSGIRIGNRFYVDGELGAVMGHRVHCRFDPHAPDSIVVYNPERTQFLCVARDRAAMANADLAREAMRAQKINSARVRDIREASRRVPRLRDVSALLLGHADAPSFLPSPESAEAMAYAATPAVLAQREALKALEESRAPEPAIEPTPEQIEGARLYELDEKRKSEVAPAGITKCIGYERPKFIADEYGYFAWLTEHRDILDADDQKKLTEFEADEDFQWLYRWHLRQQHREATQ